MTTPIPGGYLDETETEPRSGVYTSRIRRKRILVVDADPVARALTAETLAFRYEVIETGDGLSALRVARRLLPALVICETALPAFDGFELARLFRRKGPLSGVPIIFMSARSTPEDLTAAMRAGASRFVVKPFVPDALLHAVGRIVAP
jgi:CheY-like chemotaxis protein